MPRRRVGGATVPDAEPESTATARVHAALRSIDAISIIIKGAGSPLEEGSHLLVVYARQRGRIRNRL